MREMWNQLWGHIGATVPGILGAVIILVVGWLAAVAVSTGVRAGLNRTRLDDRIGEWVLGRPPRRELAGAIARVVFYFLMLIVLVLFFDALKLTLITEPINTLLNEIFSYAPRLLGGALLLVVVWVGATLIRMLLSRGLGATGFDRRFADTSGREGGKPISRSIADAVFWLILLLFLPAILGAFGIQGLLEPVQSLTTKILAFLPNLLAAALILFVGWLVARIVQRVVAGFLVVLGTDRLSERVGLSTALGKQTLSGVLSTIVYALILIPVVISALNALQLEAVTTPASDMLNMILAALPSIFAAAVVLILSYVIGRLITGLVANILTGIGFNGIPAKIGLPRLERIGDHTLSQFVGSLALIAIMLFAASEAGNLLGFTVVTELLSSFLVFAGDVVLGLIILGIGLFFANLVSRTIRATGSVQSGFLSVAARVAIIVLATAMALGQMGVAGDIINLAFTLLLGAVAVAVAVAFGLGGRDAAARQLESWKGSMGDRRGGPEG